MILQGYTLRVATLTKATFYKKYENNSLINQVLTITFDTNKYIAQVELSQNDTYVNQALLDEMQIALNRTNKDGRELGKLIISELFKKWRLYDD